jgi:arylsulfatase A-like enzyme
MWEGIPFGVKSLGKTADALAPTSFSSHISRAPDMGHPTGLPRAKTNSKLIDMGTRSTLSAFAAPLLLLFISVGSAAAAKPGTAPNIVLITLDSARADRMGFLGAHQALTPNLDRLAAESVVFSQADAQAPLTVASSATLLTGTYPQTHHATDAGVQLPESLPYLPALLHAHGYRTAAFVGSILLDPRNGPFEGYDRGFDTYNAGFHQPQRGVSRYQTIARREDEVVARAVKWLPSRSTQPLFLWVHLSMAPASSPALYDRSVRAADQAVGKWIAALKLQKLYDDALIIVVSDHGESLGEHGEQGSGMLLYNETTHVPLLLKLPESEQLNHKQVGSRVRLLDMAPTVLEVAGLTVPGSMQGQSLLRIARSGAQVDQPAYARSDFPQRNFACSFIESWRVSKYLYVNAPRPELYDLSADPEAVHNLAQSAKATMQVLAAQLTAFDRHLEGNADSGVSRLTSSDMQKLASLGYIGLQSGAGSAKPAIGGIDPKDAIGLANQTLAAWRLLDDGKPEPAIAQLKTVLASRSNLYLAQYGMGIALSQQKQYRDSVEFLRNAIKLQPESAGAHAAMGESLRQTGDFKTAVVHLEIASKLQPESAVLQSSLADVYEHLGRTQDAAKERTKAASNDKK